MSLQFKKGDRVRCMIPTKNFLVKNRVYTVEASFDYVEQGEDVEYKELIKLEELHDLIFSGTRFNKTKYSKRRKGNAKDAEFRTVIKKNKRLLEI